MVHIVKHDLEFILKQIKIAEAHSAGTPLNQIRIDANGNISTNPNDPLAIPAPLSPYGLRTVDGSYNNMMEGRDQWGAADNPFPQITDPFYRNEGDDAMPAGYVAGNNNNYGQQGDVVDADPRLISNLIVDQTLENPAAISAALTYAGITGAKQTTAINEIRSAYLAVKNGTGTQSNLDAALAKHGVEMDGKSVVIPNVAPDEGLSASYNGWFTLFGQFFDHGLDLVSKAGGTVYIPLSPDDPLYNPASPRTNFMVLTRTANGGENLTTPWVDQNQTYTSNASHQLFLREYAMVDGKPVSTGRLLEGDRGLATWADVKEQARTMLGIELTDADVTNIPMFVMDEYGEFVRGENGFPQIIRSLGADQKFGGGDDVLEEGNPSSPISTFPSVRTNHAFLDDIAHDAKTINDRGQKMYADDDNALGVGQTLVANPNFNADLPESSTNQRYLGALNPDFNPALPVSAANPQYIPLSRFYDDEKLDSHYITGDGRGNENIGLSAVHHVFHSEHNHTVEQVQFRAIESGDLSFLNEWLLVDLPAGTVLPPADDAAAIETFAKTLTWDGERLFQAARFTTEMQYQHLVFEEFARKVQPDVDAFVFNPSVDINPNIFAEFAHVVYRFGHSMLNQEVAATNANGSDASMDLFDAFLNPLKFGASNAQGTVTLTHDQAAGAIVRGMTSQVGNEIDEFVTDVLRNQLVGIPLDLAALNIARGRETGMPPLNEARRQFQQAANGDSQLDAYASWTDFALNLKNPASIVNFIAAYGTHPAITAATTVAAKREAAMALVFGDGNDGDGVTIHGVTYTDRHHFLNATGSYAAVETTGPLAGRSSLGGLEYVDLWVGGLAEKKMAFGGMLGSTFSFIFELQLENLQNADRFYYLSRVQGLNFLNELENNSFAKMVLNNTDLGETGYALPGDIFSVPDHVLYMDKAMQTKFGYSDPVQEDPWLEALSPLVERRDANNDGVAEYIRVNTNDHVLIQGTNGNDTIVAGGGDDSVWGRDGDDKIEAGYGVDKIHGGKGDDIITNSGTDIGEVDMFHGEEGNDVIHAGSGLALVFGNEGQDFLITGPDGKEAFGGLGNDFILGGEGGDFLLGNEGDDWIEAGNGFDTTAGDNSELNFNSTIIGHDVMFAGNNEHDFDAESGDDIMVQGESVMRNEGMWGFDWAIHKGNQEAADSDLTRPIFTTDEQDILRDRFDAVEALSGWDKNDVLKGDNRGDPDPNEEPEPGENPNLAAAENTMVRHELTQAGVNRISGLRDLLGNWAAAPVAGDLEAQIAFDDGNILLGGGGSDLIEGRGGNDLIDGDSWLNVRIRITVGNEVYTADGMAQKVYREVDYKDGAPVAGAVAQFGGKTLDALMLSRTLNPGQLSIVREVVKDDGMGDIDTAVFWDVKGNYSITLGDNGSIIVSHTGFDPANLPAGVDTRVSDGVDKLRNVEVLKFADGNVSVRELLNTPLNIITNGGEPIALTVDENTPAGTLLVDVDTNPPPVGLKWSITGGNERGLFVIDQGTGRITLASTPNYEALKALGTTFALTVAVTDGVRVDTQQITVDVQNVNEAHTGTVTLGYQADTGALFVANSIGNDPDGAGSVTYQWQALIGGTWTNIGGATGTTFTPGPDEVGRNLRVAATYVDGGGFTHLIPSDQMAVYGSDATNTLTGLAGRDIVLGLGGNDVLRGNGGDDTLTGGLGKDTLTGGIGADTFVFTSAADSGMGSTERDVISDWESSDRIDLSAIDASTQAGHQSFVFAGQGAVSNSVAAGQVKYFHDNGNTYVVGDVTGDGIGDFKIDIRGLHTLTAANILGVLANRAPTGPSSIVLNASNEDTAITLTAAQLLQGWSDPDLHPLSIQNLQASSGNLVNNGNGTWTFTPAANDTTGVTFTYTVSDGGLTKPASATLDLLPVNDFAPTGGVAVGVSQSAPGTLTASHTLQDGDGLGAVTYQWQAWTGSGWTNLASATGESYQPTDLRPVRAVASYTDGGGTLETVISSQAVVMGTGTGNALTGTAGADILVGLGGKDTLSGGTGADTFVLTSAADSGIAATQRDVITGWESSDTLDLSAIDARPDQNGHQSLVFVEGLGAVSNRVDFGHVRHFHDNNATYVIGDVTGDGVADFKIEIRGLHTLTADNILVLDEVVGTGPDPLG
ncbi:peroxidase family protein [Microvirga soli]|uniref:peroxidase family protein n=1 Tax=Microvirga soli TaxID=1854496 RepID=UPI00191F181C|nr:peroxidase family protein [Microvirga soli]